MLEDYKKENYDLLKFHYEHSEKIVQIILKFHSFFILITGGILTYVLALTTAGQLKFALIIPILIGIVFAIFFQVEKKQFKRSVKSIDKLATLIKLEKDEYPNFGYMNHFLNVSIILYIAIILALLVLLICKS